MADEMRRLLDHIVEHYVVRDEVKTIDLDAPPREPAEVIDAEKRDVVRREQERADELADAFAHGLARAHHRNEIGGHELALDDRKPEEDRMADALIRFLVSHDLASSRTEETVPLHYTYYLQIDWDRIAGVAGEAGVDLDRAIAKYATSP
ncbi:MAG: hypothetical protein WKF80_07465 [Thermomicrobiales bacterium]